MVHNAHPFSSFIFAHFNKFCSLFLRLISPFHRNRPFKHPKLESKSPATMHFFVVFAVFFAKMTQSEVTPNDSIGPNLQIPSQFMEGLSDKYITLEKQGITLHYVEGGDVEKPLLLFVHGFPEFWYAFRHQMQHFRHNYHVVAIDLRGFGLSERPSTLLVSNYKVSKYAADLAEAIPQLANGKEVTLIAHDIGAVISIALVYSHPSIVQRIVLMNGPNPATITLAQLNELRKKDYVKTSAKFFIPFIGEKTVKGNDFGFLQNLFLGPDGVEHKGPNATFGQSDVDIYKAYYSQKGAVSSALGFYRGLPLGALDTVWDKITSTFKGTNGTKIQPKCLVLWGQHDAVFGPDFGEATANSCEHGRLALVDSSHWVPEDAPEQVNAQIEAFLGETE